MTETTEKAPPALPADPETFYRAAPVPGASDAPPMASPDAPPAEEPPALERLGPAPFRKTGFPLLGFLATLYEHVSEHVAANGSSGDGTQQR